MSEELARGEGSSPAGRGGAGRGLVRRTHRWPPNGSAFARRQSLPPPDFVMRRQAAMSFLMTAAN
jgi:hypothetical protein